MQKVSIIVPVYNVEQYLSDCLESILRQTLSDIEIICVDDGSTDRSSEILDQYAGIDNRIRVFHNTNHGYGYSMNFGMNLARGEYIGIVESDDAILGNMYEELYRTAKDNDLDIVKGNFFYCWDSLNYRSAYYVKELKECYGKVYTSEDRSILFRFIMNTWSGIYRKAFLDKYEIRHNESPGASYQDNGFWMQTMLYANRVMWLPGQYYLYRQDNEGASIKSTDKVFALLEEYKWIENRLRGHELNPDLLIYCHRYRLIRHYGNFLRIADEHKYEFASAIVDDYKKYKYALEYGSKIDNWYKNLIQDPKVFCDEHIAMKKELTKVFDENDKIWIYGAGFPGQKVQRVLTNIHYEHKVCGYVQTYWIIYSQIGNVGVWNPFDPSVNLQDGIVIIGYKKNDEDNKKAKMVLKKLGVEKMVESDDIFDSFYSVY
ncbi:glycosyltransferase family 2 protein [Butyrivibrio sp. WCE2006]|uniref:glycosyltransferase family 2 protein n=1 Tax=Butyrivibrio sp. WCE2006 TaxID=1410611 RepID=UPI0006793A38|nr:glycosyltransferase [Butyrivibrio sp. WCE2006]